MTFLRSLHVKIMMACIAAFIVSVIGINLFDLYQLGMLGILAIIIFPITVILAGRRFAPAPFNNFTTWIVIIMIGICILHWIGQDDKGLLMSLFSVDFVYMWLLYHDPVREYMVANDFSFFRYIVRIGLGLIYGVLLDVFVYFLKKIMK
ncbi:hypothetical protein [Lysinibacillus xylanilyticus]|uniref:Uncharacterized protein n=1 Tax=Lysinibacillus xylanilyticus TaxID=582475 RepID=A0A2M9Q1L3_9BACI|nr:hypothetical protein [Lysinibacillus xylanilyticus]PJO41975.1 hypothetical protein CWD94_20880 [Lysinibacillus xylanilyticus]